MIESYLIESFIAFVEEGTLSAASEKLLISQPALSRSMKKLEETLQVKLFERTKNSIALNENGEIFYQYALDIKKANENAINKIQAFNQQHHPIRVGQSIPGPQAVYESSMKDIFPDAKITFTLQEDETSLLDSLANNEYDLIFTHQKYKLKDYICLDVFEEVLGLSVLPANPIASYTNGISFQEVDGITILQLSSVGYWNDVVQKHLQKCRILHQSNRDDLDILVHSSTLPTFVTNITSSERFKQSGRVRIPFIDDDAKIQVYAIFHKDHAQRFTPLFEQ